MMRSPRILIILILIFFSSQYLYSSEDGYSFNVRINGINDTVCYLGYYYGDKTYLADTAYRDKNGNYNFEGNKALGGGLYIVVGQNKTKFFEFLLNDSQHITFKTNYDDVLNSMEIKNSSENKLFFDYLNYLSAKGTEIRALQELAKKISPESDSIQLIQNQIKLTDTDVKKYQQEIIVNNPNTLVSSFVKASVDPPAPEPRIDKNGSIDSSFLYYDFKTHYFDNIDLSDERLLRTPFYHKKVDDYFSNVLLQHPDTIINEIDKILSKIEENEEVFKYLLWYYLVKYEQSKVMGFDAIFVHLSDEYLSTGRAEWMNETAKNNIIDRARILKPLLLGSTSPNMILLDTNDKPVSLHHIDADYTIIFFWDTDCSFCKKEVPKLKSFYSDAKDQYNMEVYAVCIDTSFTSWKNYIVEKKTQWINVNGYLSYTPDFHDLYDVHSSPVFYLIDKDKKIIAKRILTDQMEAIILHKEKR